MAFQLDSRIPLSVQQPEPFNGLGQIQQVRAQQQQQQLRQQQINSNQALEEERRQQIGARQRAEQQTQQLDTLLSHAFKPDPETGVFTFDRSTVEQGLMQGGMGHLYPTMVEHLDKLDETAKRRAADGRSMVAQSLVGIGDAGYTPQALISGAAYLKKNGVITDDHLKPILDAAAADPSPENIKGLVTKLGGGMPEYQNLLSAKEKDKAALAKTQAETAKITAEAANVGKPAPITPYQQATLAQGAQRIAIDKGKADREARAAAQQSAAFGAGAGRTGVSATLPPGTRNDDYLKQLPTPTADKVKALVEGRLQLPTRFTKGDTYWQGLLDAAVQYDPSFDAVNYNARSKTRADFTSGASSKTVNALNTVAQHLNRLSESADKLNNTWSPTYNSVANFVSRHSGSPVVTNFETDKKAVVDELTRTWRQAGGTESDIKSWSAVLDAANSPDQIHGALGEMSELIEGKLKASENQYQQGMGTDKVSVITPEARAVLDKLMGRSQGAAPTAPAAPAGGQIVVTAPDGSKHPFATQAEAAAFKRLAGIP